MIIDETWVASLHLVPPIRFNLNGAAIGPLITDNYYIEV